MQPSLVYRTERRWILSYAAIQINPLPAGFDESGSGAVWEGEGSW